MPSPFPGMNPYLEQEDVWQDFHQSFMPLVREMLESQVGAGYIVKVETHLYIHDLEDNHIERDAYLEIRDRHSRQLITVIELLSPSNKQPGPDRTQYEAKRAQILGSNTHFVEIDLLRGWPRMPMEDPPECDYCVLVCRVERRFRGELWPWRLREPLPSIPVPLKAPDPDARIDLKQVLDRVYDAAHYQKYIYQGDPNPPLSAEDAAWVLPLVPVGV